MKKSNHIEYLTTAKGILILLVVLGHSNVPFRDFIYLFHVAAFFFISGIFYKSSYVKMPLVFIAKKIKSLYIPFVAYSAVFVLFHNFFVKTLIYSPIYGANNERNYLYDPGDYFTVFKNILTFGSTEQLLVSLWFITSLFTISLIMIVLDVSLNRFPEKIKNSLFIVIVTILFSTGMLLSHYNIELPRFINVSLVSLMIFYAGYRLKHFLAKLNFNFAAAVCCFITLILSTYYGNQELVTNRYPNPSFFILNSSLGIYLVLYISQLVTKIPLANTFFNYIGNNSFHVLALHCLGFKLASLIIIRIYNLPIEWLGKFFTITEKANWWPLYGFMGVVAPLVVVYIYQYMLKPFRNFTTYEKKSH